MSCQYINQSFFFFVFWGVLAVSQKLNRSTYTQFDQGNIYN